MKVKFLRNHRMFIQFGGTNGESYMIRIQFFGVKPRLTVCFNTDTLIKLFGFNQKTIGY